VINHPEQKHLVTAMRRKLVCLLSATLLFACQYGKPIIEDRDTSAPKSNSTINPSLPEIIDPDRQYLFYIHGKIIEDEGVDAVSPQYGPYEFEAILSYLADAGFDVIGEVRSGTANVERYAERVSVQVDTLLAEGVPSENITIVGFSKGAYITILTSARLNNPDLNFVLIAICVDEIIANPSVSLTGRILSLYEISDEYGSTCKPLADKSPEVTDFVEIEFDTGKQHGAFYSADPVWLDPLIAWIVEAKP
jgi:hypothetical protein